MPLPAPLTQLLIDSLSAEGFGRQRSNWYRGNEETAQVVNLQKSQYGDQYYLNFGTALKALGAAERTAEHKCHIRFRLESAAPRESEADLRMALDFENPALSHGQRWKVLSSAINDHALPLFQLHSTLAGIEEFVRHADSRQVLIHKDVKPLLSAPEPAGVRNPMKVADQ